MPRLLEDHEIGRQLPAGWSGDTASLRAAYSFPSFMAGIACVDEVAVEADEMDHHPDIDIRWRTVSFVLSTHSAGGVTQYDVELAHRIAAAASRRGGVVAG